MPVFVSYSHSDRGFVSRLAKELVDCNTQVWVDFWELNVGDSILDRVQNAIQDSSALLIVLSKASVASAWCKKELNAGLMRELDERRVLVLPVLVEDCEIPVFLREKLYADFRTKFSVGLKSLVEAVSRVTSLDQGRMKGGGGNIDWSETWGYADHLFRMDYTYVEVSSQNAFTILTEVSVTCNDYSTRRYEEYEKAGLDWVGRMVITQMIADLTRTKELKLLVIDQHPVTAKYRLQDAHSEMAYDVFVRCRRMGEDNGKDQLVNVTTYVQSTIDQMRQTARKLTSEEVPRLPKRR